MPVPIPQKPQTLRQAKKAYQKASGPRISDAERRRLKRAEQLQERADRIKEKDKQKRINRKKKEEKEQKERDTRRRMGLETEKEEKLSPRQFRIGVFFGRKDGREDGRRTGDTKRRKIEADSTGEEEEGKGQLRREPLKELQPNTVRQEVKVANGGHSSPKPKDLPGPLLGEEDWASFFASSTQIAREISGPNFTSPPPPQPSQSPQRLSSLPRPREKPSDSDVADCLALFSSQDLEDYEDPPATSAIPVITTQPPSPQKAPHPNAEASNPKAESPNPDATFVNPPAKPTFSFSDLPSISTQDLAFTDEDLQDLGLALPALQPSPAPKTKKADNPAKQTNPPKPKPKSNPNRNPNPKPKPKPKPEPNPKPNPKAPMDPGNWDLHLWDGFGKENARAHKDLYYDMLADCDW